jgi:hypothetical protein
VAVADGPVPDAAPGTTDGTGGEIADFPDRDATEQPGRLMQNSLRTRSTTASP